jgi:hypothetical protein
MAHYELKNVVLLYNLVSSTHRYLKNKKLLHGIESKLLQCLRSSAIVDDETKHQKLVELKEAIEEADKNANGGKILHSIDLLAWVNSKLLGKPMGTLSAQNYLKKSKQEAKKYLKK